MTSVVDYALPEIILAPTADPVDADFQVGSGSNVCVRINDVDGNLGFGESVTIRYVDAGGNSHALVDAVRGAAVIVGGTGQTTITISTSGRYIASKSLTTELTGLEIIRNNAT